MTNEQQLREDIKQLCKQLHLHQGFKLELFFKKNFKDLYLSVLELTHFLDGQHPSFGSRLHCIINEIMCIPRCTTCGKELDIHGCKLYALPKKHCSIACSRRDKSVIEKTLITKASYSEERLQQVVQRRSQTIDQKLRENPDYWKERALKARATKKAKHGKENYMLFGTNEYQAVLEKKYHDKHYSNREKAKATNANKPSQQKLIEQQKRITTFKKHIDEDSSFLQNIAAKSKATRIENNGTDYTGRAKCKKTMLQRHGVENAFQIESVKQKIKQTNLKEHGVKHYSQSDECKKKVAKTCMQKYGASCYLASDEGKAKVEAQNLAKHGVKCNWQRDDVKNKIKQTNIQRYGTASAMQNSDIRKKAQQRWQYDGIHFDSLLELALHVWLVDNEIDFIFQPNASFQYEHDGKVHFYQPDFLIEGKLYEIKGLQFFKDKDPSKEMVNPYDHSQDALYEAKHQCMLKNGVKIIVNASKYVDYLKQKFTKDEILSFRKSHKK